MNVVSLADIAELRTRAEALQRIAEVGVAQSMLHGKLFGVLQGTDEALQDEGGLFDKAATELGGRVAYIHPGLTESSAAREIRETAQMLDRLYDAVLCDGMAPDLVRRLRAEAGVPVYDHITSLNHPIAMVAAALGSSASISDNRRFALQAWLLRAIP